MKKYYESNDFLAKWANGELSEEEKETFKKTEDYTYYQVILEGTDLLEIPAYDKESLFEAIQKNKVEQNKVIRLVPKWVYAAAASIALLMGYMFFYNQTISYETGFGEQLAIVLPDNSKVILNAKSKIEYKKENWGDQRVLTLEGEAYFKVEKGETFRVDTDNGSVTVLGTQFTVNSDYQIFEIICFEGKVKVENKDQSKVLTKGQGRE